MSLQEDAVTAAKEAHPVDLYTPLGAAKRHRVPYAQGYIAGARRAVTDEEVDAAARAINPEAWKVWDQAEEDVVDTRSIIVYRSRQQARTALEAARAVR